MEEFSIDMREGFGKIIEINEAVGYLIHEPTHSQIVVFKRINWWQAWWLNFCFGLKYKEI